MKRILRDHGQIIHFAGGRHLMPVQGADETALGFAAHGELAGRRPIGWNVFFPSLEKAGHVVVFDDATEALTVEAPPPRH